jgi:hypothetical protein
MSFFAYNSYRREYLFTWGIRVIKFDLQEDGLLFYFTVNLGHKFELSPNMSTHPIIVMLTVCKATQIGYNNGIGVENTRFLSNCTIYEAIESVVDIGLEKALYCG